MNQKVLLILFKVSLCLILLQISIFAKDDWIEVQSKNFHLIGNASEKEIRKVATKLEQFRETFRILFRQANFNSSIPTNVVVFKNSSAYKPFKPKRSDGKIDEWIAGYFQSGADVNYITLSTEREDAETYGTIFHEYVHFLVNNNFGKGEIPPWFNEGLAEYYQTFEIEDDIKAKLGLPQSQHIELLRQTKLIPLQQLFSVTNYSLKENGNHSRSIFYAQSWALIHYLIQGSKGAKNDGLNKFLNAILNNVPLEKAFQDSFQMSFAEMEKELNKYISQSTYQYQYYTFKQKLVFDNEMSARPISESDANAYLGDLLFHIHRIEDAEPFLQKTLAADPNSSLANTTLGSLKIRQRKFDEAKKYLEKAISNDHKNHMAYYNYAYLLSREGMDEFGFVSKFDSEKARQMRESLNKSISINPNFIESYELLGFISLVNNEQMDETIQLLKKALTIQPGNQEIILRIAEILSRQEKFDDALVIAEKVARTTDEDSIKSRAENLKKNIQTMKNITAHNEQVRKQYESAINSSENSSNRPPLTRRQAEKEMTPEETAKAQEREKMIQLNKVIKKPGENERQIIGRIQKITCAGGSINYSVKTSDKMVSVYSKDFQNLQLMAYAEGTENAQIGCNADLSKFNAVLTYQTGKPPKLNSLGELVAIDFVPGDFRLLDKSELLASTAIEPDSKEAPISNQPPPVPEGAIIINESTTPEQMEQFRRNAMMKAIKEQLRKPQPGEKQQLGTIEKIECDNKGQYFIMNTAAGLLKLKAPQNVQIRAFVPDAGGMQFGCGMKAFDIPSVFVFREDPNPKAKINGELVSIDFVPKSFNLEN
ncbi:MAG: tetratricopeptide repeat protein [Pyrinomonadaceae bacterium]|nr:tetratricopeptide repeat protein [Pyrinomonadaceae bacterium]